MKRYENIERMQFEGVGEYGIPTLEKTDLKEEIEFIPFNFAASCPESIADMEPLSKTLDWRIYAVVWY